MSTMITPPPPSAKTVALFPQNRSAVRRQRIPRLAAACGIATLLIIPLSGCGSSSVTETTNETASEVTATNTNTNTNTTENGSSYVRDFLGETSTEEVTAYDPSNVEVLTEFDYEGWNIALLDDATTASYTTLLGEDETIFSITLKITNNSGESDTVMAANGSSIIAGNIFAVSVFQGGIQCDATGLGSSDTSFDLYDRVLLQDENEGLTIQDGVTLYIPVFYVLNNETSEISLTIDSSIFSIDAETLLSITYTPGA